MSLRSRPLALLVLAVLVPVSSALASASAERGSTFKLSSTLDGKKVLPLRIRWRATPHLSTAKVKKVEFLIDGRWLWTEHHAPYFYGGDDPNRRDRRNSLVTSFLKPGLHAFTARAITIGGRAATDTVKARVVQAPPPPAQLVGTWKRHMNGPCGPCNKNDDETVSIATTGWGFAPHASTDKWDARYQPHTRIVFGPEVILPRMSPGARLGAFCGLDPLHTWAYTVASDDQSFQLEPIGKDPCPDRQNLLEGTWTRVS